MQAYARRTPHLPTIKACRNSGRYVRRNLSARLEKECIDGEKTYKKDHVLNDLSANETSKQECTACTNQWYTIIPLLHATLGNEPSSQARQRTEKSLAPFGTFYRSIFAVIAALM
jgi:hypothetical protein